jgi:glutathione S-transferase
MVLVGQYDSPFVRRVAVTLHHYAMPFTRNTWSVFADAKDMRKINPLVRIPSLILDGGETLIDSAAIIDTLDEMAGPAQALVPARGPERRSILRAVAMAQGAAEKAVQIAYERLFHHGESLSREWEQRCQSQLAAGMARRPLRCALVLRQQDVPRRFHDRLHDRLSESAIAREFFGRQVSQAPRACAAL